MNPERWTQKTREAVQDAEGRARQASHRELQVPHLLQALAEQGQGLVPALLSKVGVAPALAVRLAQDELDKLPKVEGGELRAGQDFVRLMEAAEANRLASGDDFLSTEHLLIALAAADTPL
ncbi:MAG: Clp protease N-terminal domain-containing protein, partial [Planctomycetota bacterium]